MENNMCTFPLESLDLDTESSSANYSSTRYFRMIILELFHGANVIAISGFEARSETGAIIDKSTWRIHEVTNQNASNLAENVLDENPETFWSTDNLSELRGHYITIDMGREHTIGSICYIPVQNTIRTTHGRIKSYALAFYNDHTGWRTVKHGSFNPGNAPQDIVLIQYTDRQDLFFISRKHSHIEDMIDRGFSAPRAEFEPTGLYCSAAGSFYVYIERDLPGNIDIELFIGTMGRQPTPSRYKLTKGANIITPGREGLLYVSTIHPDRKFLVPISFRNVSRSAYYVLGKTTRDEWRLALATSAHIPVAQLSSGKAIIAITVANARKYEDENIDELLHSYNRIISRVDEVCGLNQSDSTTLHWPTQSYYQLNESDSDDVYMYASYYHIGFHRETAHAFITVGGLTRYNGWGPWHEIGHWCQMPVWNWIGTTESTNNVIAAAMESLFGVQPTYIDRYGGREQAESWLERDDKKIETAGNMINFVMFNRLTELFGTGFYPMLYREYRRVFKNPDFIRDTSTSDLRRDMFAFISSKCAGKNLIRHFEYWGFDLSDRTKQRIVDLNYPEL